MWRGTVQCWDLAIEECIWTYPPPDLKPLEWVKAVGTGYDTEGNIAVVLIVIVDQPAEDDVPISYIEFPRNSDRCVITP